MFKNLQDSKGFPSQLLIIFLNGSFMLEKYLTQEKILIEIKVSDWRELIGVVGNILVQTGDIESRYIDAMIKVIEDLGPYAVIAPGVVLLHARPEDGVKRVCIAMATLAQGINFGSVNDPVRLAMLSEQLTMIHILKF